MITISEVELFPLNINHAGRGMGGSGGDEEGGGGIMS